MPMYTTDIYHYGTQPIQTLVNKTSPMFNIVAEMIRNKDFYGTQIRNDGDPLVKQMLVPLYIRSKPPSRSRSAISNAPAS
jgi:hypothetical protein